MLLRHIWTHLQSRRVNAHQLPGPSAQVDRLPHTRLWAIELLCCNGVKEGMHAALALPLAPSPFNIQETVDHIAWSSQPDAFIQQLNGTLKIFLCCLGLLCTNSSSHRRHGVASNIDRQLLPIWYGACMAQQTVCKKCASTEPIKLGSRLPSCGQDRRGPQDRNPPRAFAMLACAIACWRVTCLVPARHTSCLRNSRHVPETVVYRDGETGNKRARQLGGQLELENMETVSQQACRHVKGAHLGSQGLPSRPCQQEL